MKRVIEIINWNMIKPLRNQDLYPLACGEPLRTLRGLKDAR